MNFKSIRILFAALVGLVATSASSKATSIIYIAQEGNNVVATGLGTIDLTDLTQFTSGDVNARVAGPTSTIIIGSGIVNFFQPISGPSFGSGAPSPVLGFNASSSSGGVFGIDLSHSILVPIGYSSGTFISGTDEFDSTTIAGLGLTPGIYSYNWGTGKDADSLTLNIGSVSPVPLPSTWGMMLMGLIGLGFIAYRQKSKPALIVA